MAEAAAGVAGALSVISSNLHNSLGDSHLVRHSQSEAILGDCNTRIPSQFKRRRMSYNKEIDSLPTLHSSDYFTKPSIDELAAREIVDSGYCSRVPDFMVGRVDYGSIKFLGNTDVRWLNLDQIVKFQRHSVVVYDNEADKPLVGQGLNKPAEVTLILKLTTQGSHNLDSARCSGILKKSNNRQGACFISFDISSRSWTFRVNHFSRFGLDVEEEDDIVMDDANINSNGEVKDSPLRLDGAELSHSLPAHLGLDPARMQEMRALMFSAEDEDEGLNGSFPEVGVYSKEQIQEHSPGSNAKRYGHKTSVQGSSRKAGNKNSSSPIQRPPQALLEYNVNNTDLSPSMDILLSGQKKGLSLTRFTKVEGFKLEEKHAIPLSGGYSKNIVDAALFMGRSFRVGWGPNGILVHSGTPVGSPTGGLSSQINIQKIAIDKPVRDESNKIHEELVDLSFSSPLNLHKLLEHETYEPGTGSCKIKLQRIVCSCFTLPEICRAYIDIIEKKLDVSGLSSSSRIFLMHQVMVWELIKDLFSERETSGQLNDDDDGEEMMLDNKDSSLDMDIEAKPFARRADFSKWLQDSVGHRVQEEVSFLNDSSDLEQILVHLTGRQLDEAVELAASVGDVRLAILLSQAGGSMVNRSDMAQQLDVWRMNGMDFKFIESDRLKLYELLAGNIQGAFQVSSVDWKRYLGLVMWYQLPPDTPLPVIIHTYQQLLSEERVPHPVPVYIDEGLPEEEVDWKIGDNYDLSYYLMLLHANEDKNFTLLKTMFSAMSSTHDPLDYHMIWHQRGILEAIGAFSSKDLNVLDMSFVDQLLCLGQCHWAIYVVLHMPYHDDVPYIQAKLIKEILYQNCETWSTQESQYQFIEDLGIPSEWIHEALAVYFEYHGDLPEALEHFLKCSNWRKAHSIFITLVAHCLFLSSQHEEIWRITSFMEEHKSQIADWDLGAGIYVDFYILRTSLQEEDTMREQDPLEKKNEICRSFFTRLNESLFVWGSKLPADARIELKVHLNRLNRRLTYAKMSEEICDLLVSTPATNSPWMVQMNCFDTLFNAPISEDQRSSHLQNQLSVFTLLLSEAST